MKNLVNKTLVMICSGFILISCDTGSEQAIEQEKDKNGIKIETSEGTIEVSEETLNQVGEIGQQLGENIAKNIEENRDEEVEQLKIQLKNARDFDDREKREGAIIKVIESAIEKDKIKYASKWVKYLKEDQNKDLLREKISGAMQSRNETVAN